MLSGGPLLPKRARAPAPVHPRWDSTTCADVEAGVQASPLTTHGRNRLVIGAAFQCPSESDHLGHQGACWSNVSGCPDSAICRAI